MALRANSSGIDVYRHVYKGERAYIKVRVVLAMDSKRFQSRKLQTLQAFEGWPLVENLSQEQGETGSPMSL